ncbi:unnamed protein product [Cuscuta epithymum]|nr:unnamed protein product [Cuscuta epithymum]
MSRPGVDCSELVHSGSDIYGENLAWCSGEMSPEEAVKMWVDEKKYYSYNQNACAGGQMCGHYTQVVWQKTRFVGCAKALCNKNKLENTSATFITCNYYPPGNYIGERPY